MKKTKKIVALLLAAVMLVCTTVAATVAYLTSTDEVENTFTVGNVVITLDETDVDLNGVKDGETRVKENDYKLIPGHEYIKDPIVRVDKKSEKCWLFVTIVNEITAIENENETVLSQMNANGWTEFTDDNGNKVFKYATPVDPAVDSDLDIEVFEKFVLANDADLLFDETTGESAYEDKTIVVTAYAVQHDSFDTAEAAWNAAYCAE